MNQTSNRRIGRSIVALLAGFAIGIVLSIATDLGLHFAGLYPDLGKPMSDPMLLLATVYRTLYGVLSSYAIARLAPRSPMGHALIGGLVGLIVNTISTVATWNSGLGPHWYPIALAVLAMPSAWLGGKLRLAQMSTPAVA